MANDTADIFVLLLLFFLRVRTKDDKIGPVRMRQGRKAETR